jgi:multiple sugar transport system substrate-binding protein
MPQLFCFPPRNYTSGCLSAFIGLALAGCSQATKPAPEVQAVPVTSETVEILWDKGYVIEEDEAIEAVVNEWQTATGEKANLSFYNSGEIALKTLRASKAGASPDVVFSAKSVYPISEWQGKFADVSSVLNPLADRFTADALQAAKVYGSEAGEQYYAIPLNQSVIAIHYWKDLLVQAGYTAADIPQEWDDFWAFWQTVQTKLQRQGVEIYAVGLPQSATATDTYHIFEQVLMAYDVKLMDDQGRLQVNRPDVRQGIIQCLTWYTQFYQNNQVPPDATRWLDPDNNRNFLNRQVLMTPNPTLSIPAAVRNDEAVYFNQLGTLPWPHKPDGTPMTHVIETRQAIIFADAPHLEAAKSFLAHLLQPETYNQFLKTAYGRFMPATDALRTDPFWRDPADPHISTATQMVLEGDTQPFGNVLNPVYGIVMDNNIWGQVIHAMVVDGLTAEAAADKAIQEIQQIFDDWS